MENKGITTSRRGNLRTSLTILLIIVSLIATAWTITTISSTAQIPDSDFVSLPNASLSSQGPAVSFEQVKGIVERGLLIGVKGYLKTSSGEAIAGATVYMTYYLQGSYRTQSAVTDQNGYFEKTFPMNWTGWLPVTLTYYGDSSHRGISKAFSVTGEGL